ncbi:Bax inhibitor-1/YccA family protein [Chitinispirillales bacterium ANBcel5]|uniref:Bax inhibitor-1/YccA family protein n=1 Tax=Cellulosispirillum alkaliphilum TaxID=3039283 RepID=UPI002A5706F5|nr:Bax inhibitor-1/YccA family protein [Chitinispirillales bacterium ANBcel5]
MRSSNPALSTKVFQEQYSRAGQEVMDMNGTVNKSGLLLLIVITMASVTWTNPSIGMPFIPIGALGGFVIALITAFKKEWAPVTAPLYAVLQGALLGALSMMFNQMYPGIVITAVSLTFGTLLVMLMAYKTGIIKATEKFKTGVIAATGAIMLVYLGSFILGFFGVNTGILHGNSTLSIGISGVVVVVAALNLVLDFDFIENASKRGLPKYMEWYAAFGLMVTLVWLYLEILRLLAKLRSRD